jgi:hypothetical protein
MILQISRWAHDLDAWLQSRIGRPYNVLLTIGLVAEIVGRVRHLPELVTSASGELRLVFVIVLEMALLIHQVGLISHVVEPRARTGESPPPRG